MRWTVRSIKISVALVPLLVPELPLFLGLMFPQFRAIPIDVSLALLVIVETIPLGSFMLSLGVFTPISGTTPISVTVPSATEGPVRTIEYVGTDRNIISRRRPIKARSVSTDAKRKTRFSER
jgi:hypothetical protein